MNVSSADLLPLSIDIALLAGALLVFLVDLLAPRAGRALGYLTAATLFGVLLASFRMDTSGIAFSGAYVGDAWTLFIKRVFLATGLLAVLGSIDHVERRAPHRQGEYYLLVLFSLAGMTLLPGARDLILLVVCFELMGIPLFVLAAFAKTDHPNGPERDAPEAALKLYLVGVASTAVTLFGLSLIYGLSGATALARIALTPTSPLLVVAGLMVLAGLAFKIGAVPFHFWVPDTYQGASTPFVAFLSVAPKLAGFVALIAVFYRALPGTESSRAPALIAMALVSILLGNLIALVQTNVKRLLAFSGIGHIGFMLLAFVAGGAAGLEMLLFYVVAYVVTNVGAFLVVEAIEEQTGTSDIEAFNGLAQRSPTLAMAMLLFLLSLAGIPFVVGFWAKLYVVLVAWQSGLEAMVVVGAVASVVGLFYYLQIARAMYMKKAADKSRFSQSFTLNTAIGLCLAGVIVFGVWPAPLLSQAERAGKAFVGGIIRVEAKAPPSVGGHRIALER